MVLQDNHVEGRKPTRAQQQPMQMFEFNHLRVPDSQQSATLEVSHAMLAGHCVPAGAVLPLAPSPAGLSAGIQGPNAQQTH